MHSKKTRIISFLMAFLLIFTFTFINPLTVSKSYAVLPAVVLTSNGVKIIMGTLASAGIGIVAGQSLQQVDFEKASESIASVVYRTLDGAEKLLLMALSVVDNVVEVPVSLYNSIVNNGKKVLQTPEYSATLLEQGITIKYGNLTSYNSYDPDLHLPIYQLTNSFSGWKSDRVIDMREAEPFLVYDGTQSDVNSFARSECITTNYFDFSTEENPILEYNWDNTLNHGIIPLTPSLSGYRLKYSNTSPSDYNNCLFLNHFNNNIYLYLGTSKNGLVDQTRIQIGVSVNKFNSSFPSVKLFYYFIRNSEGLIGFLCDVYNGDEFVGQQVKFIDAGFGFNSVINNDTLFDTPSGFDTTISVEEMPSPVITNMDATSNVLTLPTTVADTIGLTSTDVNVGTTDVPDTPNTETIDRIDTNVGELVTGGTLGEQVNTNIGTVEGLHGEITEQVDFGAIFDTIAQYISSLDISSVTWFPTAVASFLVPFLPVISLGLILFFIDRVLNGGA